MNMPRQLDIDRDYHMRLLVDRVPSMLAYWDRELRCRFANRAYERWFGVDPDALIGSSIRDLLGPELFALNKPYMDAALRGEEQVFERIVPGPDGVRRHSLANYVPDHLDGQVVGFLVQVTEITKLRQTEEALQREQALRLQIEQHSRELDALLRERGDMLDVMAHEVRQPLNNASAALQSASQALKDLSGEAAALRVARAQTVLGQVLASLDNTLAVAALLAHPQGVQRLDSDIDMLLAVALADMPAEQRDRVRVERTTRTRTASMDLALMRLALRNLLSNALKFSPAGSPVTVRLSDLDDPLALVIEVEDEGGGIDAGLLPRLFERGSSGAQAQGPRSLGLGLYIVRRVMELHGGRVELARNSTHGVTMRLVLEQSGDD
ncbi:MAG: PAS domain-containing protein [Burkholderiaceae bacterium]|nr:PAS domain-containing protein [Burkholderiaceae bacterium]